MAIGPLTGTWPAILADARGVGAASADRSRTRREVGPRRPPSATTRAAQRADFVAWLKAAGLVRATWRACSAASGCASATRPGGARHVGRGPAGRADLHRHAGDCVQEASDRLAAAAGLGAAREPRRLADASR